MPQPPNFNPAAQPNPLVVVDVDGDGKLEVVAVGQTEVYVLDKATGAIKHTFMMPGNVGSYNYLAVGDVNGDGAVDIVVNSPGNLYVISQP
jgi:DNA/RNA endonuclease YhcR with UshA esterase domain